MLYRAFVNTDDGRPSQEMTVFFEVPPGADAYTRLVQVLSAAWCVRAEQLEAYNVLSERELRTWHGAELTVRDADHDTHLLQVGDGPDGPVYCLPDRTQCLVTPRWQQRLAHARHRVEALQQRRRLQALQQRLAGMPPPVWVLGQPAATGSTGNVAGA